jgi:hypothetical protein
MTDALFDDPEALLAAATLIEIRDATPTLTRSQRKEAEVERHRALTAEGYVVKVGVCGATVFRDFGGGNA